MLNKHVAVALFSLILSSLSQVLLKKSSGETRKRLIFEYLNVKVCVAYSVIFVCAILTVYALKGMDYKYVTAIESLSYILIMLFSRLFLKEKITLRKMIGNCVIVLGVLIFSVNLIGG